MPLLVGVLLPANLFLLDVTGLSVIELSVGDALSAWIFGTPFFVLTYTMTGIKQGIWAGFGGVLIAAGVFRYLGPNREVFSVGRTTIGTFLAATIIAAVFMFGPLGIFEVLFNEFQVD